MTDPEMADAIMARAFARLWEPLPILVIDPGDVLCHACGGSLVDGPGCGVCGERDDEGAPGNDVGAD